MGNQIPDVSSLVKKTIYDTKISELEKKLTAHNHDKYITTPEFNNMATSVFNASLAQEYLKKKTKNFMTPFYGWGSTASRLQPL